MLSTPRGCSLLGRAIPAALRPQREIGVLNHDRPAGRHGRPHPPQQVDGTAQVLQQEAAVDEVEPRRLVPVVDVASSELDVRETAFGGGRAGQRELDLVHVHASHMALGTDQPRKLERDLPAAAPEVQTTHTRPNSSAGQEIGRIRPPRSGEDPQPVVTLATTTDHIPLQNADATAAYSGAVRAADRDQ